MWSRAAGRGTLSLIAVGALATPAWADGVFPTDDAMTGIIVAVLCIAALALLLLILLFRVVVRGIRGLLDSRIPKPSVVEIPKARVIEPRTDRDRIGQ
jgi:hypothetical protein